ncbi:hypothetical protein J6590_078167 [Homalodisca vitripennis]|nr:hypothetical protein J6590_078167 [Homalodisca vitripennis]
MTANETLPIAIHVNARHITPTGMSSGPRSYLRSSSEPRHQYPGLLLVSPCGRDKTCEIRPLTGVYHVTKSRHQTAAAPTVGGQSNRSRRLQSRLTSKRTDTKRP